MADRVDDVSGVVESTWAGAPVCVRCGQDTSFIAHLTAKGGGRVCIGCARENLALIDSGVDDVFPHSPDNFNPTGGELTHTEMLVLLLKHQVALDAKMVAFDEKMNRMAALIIDSQRYGGLAQHAPGGVFWSDYVKHGPRKDEGNAVE